MSGPSWLWPIATALFYSTERLFAVEGSEQYLWAAGRWPKSIDVLLDRHVSRIPRLVRRVYALSTLRIIADELNMFRPITTQDASFDLEYDRK